MRLSDTYLLPRASRYSAPANQSDILAVVYGDLSGDGGVWPASLIHENDMVWALAAHPIISATLYDDDGEIDAADYTLNLSHDYEGQGIISTATFSTAPNGDVTASGQGKPDDAGALIENPIDIVVDVMTWMGIENDFEPGAYSRARQVASQLGYVAAGVLLQDQSPRFWLSSVLSSFLGSWWLNYEQKIVIEIGQQQTTYQVMGFLDNRVNFQGQLARSLNDLCNRPIMYYAPNFTNRDRRTTTGSGKGDYDGFLDGLDVQPQVSVSLYGDQPKTFNMQWIRADAVAQSVQSEILLRADAPRWIWSVTEPSLQNVALERGDYVVASCRFAKDSSGDLLINQIWRVLEISPDPVNMTTGYVLYDTQTFYPATRVIYDGTTQVGNFQGSLRE
jgi:hypothetical protein